MKLQSKPARMFYFILFFKSVYIDIRYAIGVGETLRAVSDIGGLAELKRNKTLAVSTPDAYTRRVKETGTITAIALLMPFTCAI